jgi:hypothetical protein
MTFPGVLERSTPIADDPPPRQWSRVFSPMEAPAWVVATMNTIDELEKLPDGWDTYGSARLQPEAIKKARTLIAGLCIANLTAPQVVPISGGGIGFVWNLGKKELELEIKPDGKVEYLRVTGRPSVNQRDTMQAGSVGLDDVNDVRLLIRWLATD